MESPMFRIARTIATLVGVVVLVAGCAFDYLQNSDKITYRAGDAVQSNLERETNDPSNDSMFDTDDLGEDGAVVVPQNDDGTPPPAGGAP